jgi:HD-GYP domain-containing protein (c-di-GMP phosphodiesterase class II)
LVAYPIRYRRTRLGVINVSDKHSGEPFTEQDLEFLSTLAGQVAVVIENARLVREMEGGYLGVLTAMIRAAEDARPETRGHSLRVARLATSVARDMGLPEPRIEFLARAAALHEVGHLSAWSEKRPAAHEPPSPDEEWTLAAAMATERALSPIGSLRGVREIILHSTDRFEDPSVPFGGDRPGIPVESRILAACEEYVRLTTRHAPDQAAERLALEVLKENAGTRHDPRVIEALCRLAASGETR